MGLVLLMQAMVEVVGSIVEGNGGVKGSANDKRAAGVPKPQF